MFVIIIPSKLPASCTNSRKISIKLSTWRYKRNGENLRSKSNLTSIWKGSFLRDCRRLGIIYSLESIKIGWWILKSFNAKQNQLISIAFVNTFYVNSRLSFISVTRSIIAKIGCLSWKSSRNFVTVSQSYKPVISSMRQVI